MRKHKELQVWQDAMLLVEHIYRLTSSFPDQEKYGLTSQMRRAAVSVPSNIAEGVARSSLPDYLRFLAIARGSLSELDTQIDIAFRLSYAPSDTELAELVQRVFAKLNALIRALDQKRKDSL
ncbi:MAG: four helix bundle protein [Arenimonas sp.]